MGCYNCVCQSCGLDWGSCFPFLQLSTCHCQQVWPGAYSPQISHQESSTSCFTKSKSQLTPTTPPAIESSRILQKCKCQSQQATTGRVPARNTRWRFDQSVSLSQTRSGQQWMQAAMPVVLKNWFSFSIRMIDFFKGLNKYKNILYLHAPAAYNKSPSAASLDLMNTNRKGS